MIRLIADENFNGDILKGLSRRLPGLDVGRVQDVGLAGADDPVVLGWAAQAGRVVVSHDVRTLIGFAYDRLRRGVPMAGVLEVSSTLGIGRAIEELLLILECSLDDEWEGQVRYVPV